MEIRFIRTEDALFYILDELRFPHLLDCMEIEGEVFQKDGEWKVQLVNGRDFTENLYTNPYTDEYRWIAGFSENDPDECTMLQLLCISDKKVELVNVEKTDHQEKGVFGKILDFTKENFPGTTVETYPMNWDLEEYYKKFGFHSEGIVLVKYPENPN